MSPLLTARPSVSVTLRLVGATAVMALIAAAIPFFGGDGRSSAVVPACLTLGIVCAALVSHLLYASSKATGDGRLAWMSVGTTLALIGLALTLLSQPSLFPDGSPVTKGADAGAARYALWHIALSGRGGARPVRPGAEAPLPAHLRRPGCPPPRLGRRCLHAVRRPRVQRRLLPHDARAHRRHRGRAGRRRRPLVAARRRRGVLGRHVRDRDDGPLGPRRVRLCRRPAGLRGRVVGEPRAARRAVRRARRRPADRLHRRRGEAARVRGRADREPDGRARAGPRRAGARRASTTSAASASAAACRR